MLKLFIIALLFLSPLKFENSDENEPVEPSEEQPEEETSDADNVDPDLQSISHMITRQIIQLPMDDYPLENMPEISIEIHDITKELVVKVDNKAILHLYMKNDEKGERNRVKIIFDNKNEHSYVSFAKEFQLFDSDEEFETHFMESLKKFLEERLAERTKRIEFKDSVVNLIKEEASKRGLVISYENQSALKIVSKPVSEEIKDNGKPESYPDRELFIVDLVFSSGTNENVLSVVLEEVDTITYKLTASIIKDKISYLLNNNKNEELSILLHPLFDMMDESVPSSFDYLGEINEHINSFAQKNKCAALKLIKYQGEDIKYEENIDAPDETSVFKIRKFLFHHPGDKSARHLSKNDKANLNSLGYNNLINTGLENHLGEEKTNKSLSDKDLIKASSVNYSNTVTQNKILYFPSKVPKRALSIIRTSFSSFFDRTYSKNIEKHDDRNLTNTCAIPGLSVTYAVYNFMNFNYINLRFHKPELITYEISFTITTLGDLQKNLSEAFNDLNDDITTIESQRSSYNEYMSNNPNGDDPEYFKSKRPDSDGVKTFILNEFNTKGINVVVDGDNIVTDNHIVANQELKGDNIIVKLYNLNKKSKNSIVSELTMPVKGVGASLEYLKGLIQKQMNSNGGTPGNRLTI